MTSKNPIGRVRPLGQQETVNLHPPDGLTDHKALSMRHTFVILENIVPHVRRTVELTRRREFFPPLPFPLCRSLIRTAARVQRICWLGRYSE